MKPKPQPPADLWAMLDADYRNHDIPPENSFTISEYAARFRITHSQAQDKVDRLVREGKVVMLGRFTGRNAKYYGLADGHPD